MEKSNLHDFLNKDADVKDLFVNNKCSECGQCCGRLLPLSNYEINTIRAYIKKNNIKQQMHSINVMADRFWDLTCPFLDDDKPNHKCTIYKVRPLICRCFTCRDFQQNKIYPQLYKVERKKVDMVETFFGSKGEEDE